MQQIISKIKTTFKSSCILSCFVGHPVHTHTISTYCIIYKMSRIINVWAVIRTHLILMPIRILDPHWNFLQFLIDILPLGSGSVDLHIFADPDPGSQNLADPTDPDPKHWFESLSGFTKSRSVRKII